MYIYRRVGVGQILESKETYTCIKETYTHILGKSGQILRNPGDVFT